MVELHREGSATNGATALVYRQKNCTNFSLVVAVINAVCDGGIVEGLDGFVGGD